MEQIIAGAYKSAGFDKVTLTPRSSDFGRDGIAVKHGIGTALFSTDATLVKSCHALNDQFDPSDRQRTDCGTRYNSPGVLPILRGRLDELALLLDGDEALLHRRCPELDCGASGGRPPAHPPGASRLGKLITRIASAAGQAQTRSTDRPHRSWPKPTGECA